METVIAVGGANISCNFARLVLCGRCKHQLQFCAAFVIPSRKPLPRRLGEVRKRSFVLCRRCKNQLQICAVFVTPSRKPILRRLRVVRENLFCPMQEVQKSAATLRGFHDTVTKTHSPSFTSGARKFLLSYAGGAKISCNFARFS